MTPCSPIGWHSGIRSGVRFAPWIAAILATASASPLGTVPSRRAATAGAESSTRPVAVAVRAVTSLAETSTILAWPAASRWVRAVASGAGRRLAGGRRVSVRPDRLVHGSPGRRRHHRAPADRRAPDRLVDGCSRRSRSPGSPLPVPGSLMAAPELRRVSGRQAGHRLGDHDQRVGPGQRGDLVRVLPGQRAVTSVVSGSRIARRNERRPSGEVTGSVEPGTGGQGFVGREGLKYTGGRPRQTARTTRTRTPGFRAA